MPNYKELSDADLVSEYECLRIAVVMGREKLAKGWNGDWWDRIGLPSAETALENMRDEIERRRTLLGITVTPIVAA